MISLVAIDGLLAGVAEMVWRSVSRLHENARDALSSRTKSKDMDELRRDAGLQGELTRLRDEVEQLRTALEASAEEATRLVEDRDRLLRRLTVQARELQAANAAYSKAGADERLRATLDQAAQSRWAGEQEELRVAFEEMQILTEELEVANNSLHHANKALDQRVQERTEELEVKNAALSESELRFRTLAEGIPQLVWRAVDVGQWTWASPQWTVFTGESEEDSHGWGWIDPVHPEDRDAVRAAWTRAVDIGRLYVEHRIRRDADGAYRWFQTRATPVRNETGRIVEWLGASTDIEDMRALQDRQSVLLHELQHRVRNTLAVVRSIVLSTGETSDTVEGFAAHLEGRLNALARTQMVLTRAPGGGVDLETMIRDELLAQVAREDQIEVSGPDVRLSPKAAEVLALAIHELATNAVKYGAFCTPSGRVGVSWTTSHEGGRIWLSLTWEETGVRVAATAPRREGFGTELIEQRVPYELRGRGALQFRSGGVRCDITFPLHPGESILQTHAPTDKTLEG
jgi:PAS domain S-box-containing protein